MGWDSGRYYGRSRKVNGRVVREYIGSGRVTELMPKWIILERERRLLDAEDLQREKVDLAWLDADMNEQINEREMYRRDIRGHPRAESIEKTCHKPERRPNQPLNERPRTPLRFGEES
jgi:hypothetical protein